ncbi:hypothetical protein DFJ73DRAFT_957172 [Zopfochytrium polystomum]|nr:hypothetical protein DFJ73DRAFT_957172 [Zopfochytrium polystomum]
MLITLQKVAPLSLLSLATSILLQGFNPVAAASPLALFVDPSAGSDSNTGTRSNAALQTIGRAQKLAAGAISANPDGLDVTINLLPGNHYVGQTIVIDRPTNTSTTSSITFKTVDGAAKRARITASRTVSPSCFRTVPSSDSLYPLIPSAARPYVLVCNAPAALGVRLADLKLANCDRGFNISLTYSCLEMQVYLNGGRLSPARWPNAKDRKYTQQVADLKDMEAGNVLMSSVSSVGTTMYDPNLPGGTFKITNGSSSQWKAWAKEKDLYINGVLSESWAWTKQRVLTVSPSDKSVSFTMKNGVRYGLRLNSWKANLLFIENAISELDDPTEVYVDVKTGNVYLYSQTVPLPANTIIAFTSSTAAPLFSLQAASRITFQNLFFELGRHNVLDVANYSSSVTVRDAEFANFAGTALYMPDPAPDTLVDNVYVRNFGSTALFLTGPDYDDANPPAAPSDDSAATIRVSRSTFANGAWYNRVYNPAVITAGTAVAVTESRFVNHPHLAVNLCGDGIYFARNELAAAVTAFRDMGAVYCYSYNATLPQDEQTRSRNTVVEKNYFHDFGGAGRYAVYMDDLTSGWAVRGNLFSRVGGSTGTSTNGKLDAVFSHGGGENVVDGRNVFVSTKAAFRQSSSTRPGGRCDDSTRFDDAVAVVAPGASSVPAINELCPGVAAGGFEESTVKQLPTSDTEDRRILDKLFEFGNYGYST